MKRRLSSERRSLIVWLLANSGGWLLGIVVLVFLLATVEELIHRGNFVYVGMAFGSSIGLAQWLAGRKWFGATSAWMCACTIGITTPCLFLDLIGVNDLNVFLLAAVASVGGFAVGLTAAEASATALGQGQLVDTGFGRCLDMSCAAVLACGDPWTSSYPKRGCTCARWRPARCYKRNGTTISAQTSGTSVQYSFGELAVPLTRRNQLVVQ